jgi:outer membrane protein OmpA-like peptidoglycan-associated protein
LAIEPGSAAHGQPAAESAPQSFREKKLAAGKKVVFRLGTGKPGTTHWHGMLEWKIAGKLSKHEVDLTTEVARNLEIRFDSNYHSNHLSIEQRFVEVQLSAPASRGELQVFADDGSDMGSGSATFSEPSPNTWLRLNWQGKGPKNPESVVLRLAITLYDRDGNSGKIDLYPWAVSVPHQEVSFGTGSSEVADDERGKLDESLRKINTVLDRVERTLLSFSERGIAAKPPSPKLYVTGHTDTVGGDSENLTLSRNRARAIANYFRQHGFRFPIFFVGFGERQPRVRTADSVDEARNRRADYTLALEAPPVLSGLSWQKL